MSISGKGPNIGDFSDFFGITLYDISLPIMSGGDKRADKFDGDAGRTV